MRYDVELKMLETRGITYHRKVAKFLTEKLKQITTSVYKPSILIVGETDMVISRQLVKNFRLHILSKRRYECNPFKTDLPIYEDISREARIIPVTKDTFNFEEYDVIVFLFTEFETFKEIISKAPYCKFIFLPDYSQGNCETLKTQIKSFLAVKKISFILANTTFPMGENIAFFN